MLRQTLPLKAWLAGPLIATEDVAADGNGLFATAHCDGLHAVDVAAPNADGPDAAAAAHEAHVASPLLQQLLVLGDSRRRRADTVGV